MLKYNQPLETLHSAKPGQLQIFAGRMIRTAETGLEKDLRSDALGGNNRAPRFSASGAPGVRHGARQNPSSPGELNQEGSDFPN